MLIQASEYQSPWRSAAGATSATFHRPKDPGERLSRGGVHHGARPSGERERHPVLPWAPLALNAGHEFLHGPEGGRDIGELTRKNFVPTSRKLRADRRIGSLRQAVAPQLEPRRRVWVKAEA